MTLLHDRDGKPSTRRAVTMAAAIALLAAFGADAIWDVEISQPLVTATQTMAMVGLGSVAIEHVARR